MSTNHFSIENRLKIALADHDRADDVTIQAALLFDALDEIEHLRLLAGGVSRGPDFADIKQGVGRPLVGE